jgi:hypothetical protein
MRQFQKVFSDRATNAFGACLCNDSNGMTAIEAKAPVRCIAVQAICGIVLCPMCEGCNRRCSASRLQHAGKNETPPRLARRHRKLKGLTDTPKYGRIIAEQLLSLNRIQARGPLPSPVLPIRLRT